uniref:Uncharacterized protein n=1 Tax=Arion vulgaris TaxID=1028688 RepID=A0A0B7A7W3_9EUPU
MIMRIYDNYNKGMKPSNKSEMCQSQQVIVKLEHGRHYRQVVCMLVFAITDLHKSLPPVLTINLAVDILPCHDLFRSASSSKS